MAGYVTVEELGEALGRPPVDDAEEDQWQFWIDSTSRYIDSNIDWLFSGEVTSTVTARSNYSGEFQLPGLPITSISTITTPYNQNETVAAFDGYDTLYYLAPNQVITVVYLHGTSMVPSDIKDGIISFLTGFIGVDDGPGSRDLRKYQVGDVVEEYSGSQFRSELDSSAIIDGVIDKYSKTGWTIDTGGYQHSYGGIPAGWPQT